LKEEDSLARNNNQQLRINTKLFDSTHESLQKLNDVIGRVNAIDGDFHVTTAVLHKAIIIADQVNEILRACQLGKTGVVNTNLLDHDEINTILAEVDSLPYQNVVEAVEFSRPTILTNGTTLLYILAMPKVVDRKYRLMRIYPTTSDGKQVVLKYTTLAMDSLETYALLGNCVSIGNTTVCREKDLLKLEEDSCIPRLLKGGQAECDFLRTNQETVELVDDGTIFLTNFNGTVSTPVKNHHLEGSYVVQFDNETITIGDRNYSSYSSTHLMAMPAVLTQIKTTGYELSLKYVHEFSMENLKKLSVMSNEILISSSVELVIALSIMTAVYLVWKKITSTKGIPELRDPLANLETQGTLEPATKA